MVSTGHKPTDHALSRRLAEEIEGEVLFDAFSRGRYATDASIYQIEPIGVVVPKTLQDVRIAAQIAREEGVPLLPRGGGTSQSGQTVGRALVLDYTRHLNHLVSVDAGARTCMVEPGIVLDDLNRRLKPTGLWFPVDVSTASRASIGGMTGNNSCGTRSIRYGIMRDNVVAIDALLPDGTEVRLGPDTTLDGRNVPDAARELVRDLTALGRREASHIAHAFPEVSRRVGGYLIDALVPGERPVNLATLLCGSEGTLALSQRIALKLSPLPKNKALGICHFATFRAAMEATRHIVELGPVAVEVVDRTLIELARDIAVFRPVMDTYVRGRPDALLLVEFAEDDQAENLRRLSRLAELMGDLGHPRSVVKVADAAGQKAVWEVRASGLNIMMSMKSEGKPVSFIEDCAVPLEHLADYTERLTAVFAKHGTRGTWYAHASVGCLHVRPVLNLKLEKDAATMRAIAEEAFAMVKAYKGSHSGEHGDGLVRSEFHERMYGARTVRLFEEVKDRFDPAGLMNPGKIVRAPRMNDRTLFRYKPDYRVPDFETALDWSAYPGAAGGFQGAVEMCNNNGECRKLAAGTMCPSYRVTRNERDVTRGRANSLRLAISGQLGPDAFTSDEMLETLKLCVSCKGCRRECPTGVDIARMKIEVLSARNRRYGLSLHDRLIAYLPRYAPYVSRMAPLMNARNWLPGAARLAEALAGFSARRLLPAWRKDPFDPSASAPSAGSPGRSSDHSSSSASPHQPGQSTDPSVSSPSPGQRGESPDLSIYSPSPRDPGKSSDLSVSSPSPRERGEGRGEGQPQTIAHASASSPLRPEKAQEHAIREVALFADTFNTYFEPENLRAATAVLTRLGYRVTPVRASDGRRPVCCGRTFLAAGLVEEAKVEAARALAALAPLARRGVPIVGLEPSCVLSFRDEVLAMRLGEDALTVAPQVLLFEEFLVRDLQPGRIALPLARADAHVLLHGHCHQKSFGVLGTSEQLLSLVDGLRVETVESSCCGMAGAFGYRADTYDASMAMGELSLLPAVRAAPAETIIAADGFSCRHQIMDGTGRKARHVASILNDCLGGGA